MTPKEILNKKKISQRELYFILLAITFTSIFITGEIMARYFVKENTLPPIPPYSKIDPYSPNPYLMGMRPFMHSHIPNAHYLQSRSYYAVDYSINSSGFRGPEIQPKSKDMKRAIIIGDSIVEGHGCEFRDTFAFKLGEKAKPFNWEVINLGVQGASPSYFAANINRYIATEPDAAFIVIFENDLYDDREQEKSYFTKPILDNPSQLYQKPNKFWNLFSQSRFFTLINRVYHQIEKSEIEQIIIENRDIIVKNQEQINVEKIAKWLVSPSLFDKQWEMSQKYLDYITNTLTERKIPIFIVYLSLGGIIPGQDKSYLTHTNTFNHKVEYWSKSKNIPFLSLIPLMNESFTKLQITDMMIKDDGHPTPKAHQMFANSIFKWLEELGSSQK
ncbi:MAG: SGNH/GDSL hydrolase family protein [Desulfamplus sp.]|nr:SGNH/GDSL hydrolase family protein [Desulfamplus sp.]